MLKPKYGVCIDCPPGTPPRFLTAGRCQTHYWNHRRQISAEKSRNRNSDLLKPNILGVWFDFHNSNNLWICENCGINLNPYNPEIRSSCQAHILPKEHFKSVMGVLDNHMTLGGLHQPCFCHSSYDSNWSKAVSMAVFPIAIERFMKFKHLILPQEVRRLPGVFRELI